MYTNLAPNMSWISAHCITISYADGFSWWMKEGRKERKKEGKKERKKERKKEGKKERRKEGKKERKKGKGSNSIRMGTLL